MEPIKEFTISLHCGCCPDIVQRQIDSLKPLSDKYKVHWNNRIDRYPYTYPSYSQLCNHAIATSPTEFIILINDRVTTNPAEIEKILHHMTNGYALSMLWNVALMGISKELIRKIGWWDERYLLGGWEDRDLAWRCRAANYAIYESQETQYEYSWKSPLQVIGHGCAQSEPHWRNKFEQHPRKVIKRMPEETYPHWDLMICRDKEDRARPDISSSWMPWSQSILNIGFDKPNSGPSSSSLLGGREIVIGY